MELAAGATAAPVPGVRLAAARVLGIVARCIVDGFAGARVAGHELATALDVGERWVWELVAELRELGHLVVVPDYVPAEETKLGARYVTRSAAARRRRRGPRSVPSGEADAYAFSRVRNLYTLGANARALLRVGLRCGQLRAQLAEKADFIATGLCSPDGPDLGQRQRPPVSRACESVDNSAPGGAEGRRAAYGVGESPPATAPPVAVELGDGSARDGGGDGGSCDGESPRRAPWAVADWPLGRFLDGGEA